MSRVKINTKKMSGYAKFKDADNQYKVNEVIHGIVNGTQKECGPFETLDAALARIKPDEFIPFSGEVGEPLCEGDPLKWWVVIKIPPCFAWRYKQCTVENCGFNHGKDIFVKIEVVSTNDMLRKRINKNRKIRMNAMKTNKDHYFDIFTGEKIPIYCNQEPKQTYNKTKELKSRLVGELKGVQKVVKLFENKKVPDAPKKAKKTSSWADMVEEEEEILSVSSPAIPDPDEGTWAKVVRGKKKVGK